LNVTTTVFRSLYETESEQLLEEGKITETGRVAVNKINGHNSKTVRRHYLKSNINSNVGTARDVHESLCPDDNNYNNNNDDNNSFYDNNNDNNNNNNNNMDCGSDSDNYCPKHNVGNTLIHAKIKWGTSHSCYQRDNLKTAWDPAEKKYLGELALSYLEKDFER